MVVSSTKHVYSFLSGTARVYHGALLPNWPAVWYNLLILGYGISGLWMLQGKHRIEQNDKEIRHKLWVF
jgi:hypothetical protein